MSYYEHRMIKELSSEERLEHYTALFNFWESVSNKYPNRYNNQLKSQYKQLMEKAI